MNADTIKINPIAITVKLDDHEFERLDIILSVNGTEIHRTTDLFEFLLGYFKTIPDVYEKHVVYNFYPITCSCGVPGCAGIWNGINLKYKRHSVEWRIGPNDGYKGIFEKNYFQFNRHAYDLEIANLWNFTKSNSHLATDDEDQEVSSILQYWNEEFPERVRYLDALERKFS
jgi:hypothetical protein